MKSHRPAKPYTPPAKILNETAKPLIEIYRRRRDDPSYYVRVQRCISSLDGVATHLISAAEALSAMLHPSSHVAEQSRPQRPLDREHSANINSMLSVYDGIDLDGLRESLLRHGNICADAAATFATFTGEKPPIKKPGRPALKSYIDETRSFMDIWKKVTGNSAVFPKTYGAEAKDASQPSTDFVLRCLQQIDPKITVANAITSIRTLLETESGVAKYKKVQTGIKAKKRATSVRSVKSRSASAT